VRIKDVLESKGGTAVATIRPEATIAELIETLADHNVGALVVSDDGRHVAGIVSERDVVRQLREGAGALDALVSDVMTTDVHVCEPQDSLNDLMRQMTEQRVRHIPVVIDGEMAGLVSIGDAVKARISELEFERDQLNQYVAGSSH
jgi:CBS domain-containing protein